MGSVRPHRRPVARHGRGDGRAGGAGIVGDAVLGRVGSNHDIGIMGTLVVRRQPPAPPRAPAQPPVRHGFGPAPSAPPSPPWPEKRPPMGAAIFGDAVLGRVGSNHDIGTMGLLVVRRHPPAPPRAPARAPGSPWVRSGPIAAAGRPTAEKMATPGGGHLRRRGVVPYRSIDFGTTWFDLSSPNGDRRLLRAVPAQDLR